MTVWLALAGISGLALAQKGKTAPKKGITIAPAPKDQFHPTFNMGAGSVGSYFYPQSVGTYWKMKIVQKYFRADNSVISSDSIYSLERVVSNSLKSDQGLPFISCETQSWRGDDTLHAEKDRDSYYVDDSLIMAIFNNSLWSNQNKVLLVSPLKLGAHWLEQTGDSVRCEIVSMHDTVTTPYSGFGNALVTVSRAGLIELDKYFVPNVGLVKTIMRRPGSRDGEAVVVTSELIDWHLGTDANLPVDGGLQNLVPGTVPGQVH